MPSSLSSSRRSSGGCCSSARFRWLLPRVLIVSGLFYINYAFRLVDLLTWPSKAEITSSPFASSTGTQEKGPSSPNGPSGHSGPSVRRRATPSSTPAPSPSTMPFDSKGGLPYQVANLAISASQGSQAGSVLMDTSRFSEEQTEEHNSRAWWHFLFYKRNEKSATGGKVPLLPCHLWSAVHAPDVAAFLMLQYHPGDCRAISNPLLNPLCRNKASYDLFGCRAGARIWEVCEQRKEWAGEAELSVQICSPDGMPAKVPIRPQHPAQVLGDPGSALIPDFEIKDEDGNVVGVKPLPVASGGANEGGLMQHYQWDTHRSVALRTLRERLPPESESEMNQRKKEGVAMAAFLPRPEMCMTKRIFIQHSNPLEHRGPSGLSARFLHAITSGLRMIGVPFVFHPFKTRRYQAALSIDGSGILLSTNDIARGADGRENESEDPSIMHEWKIQELLLEKQFETLAVGPAVRWSNVAPIAPSLDYSSRREMIDKKNGESGGATSAVGSISLWKQLYQPTDLNLNLNVSSSPSSSGARQLSAVSGSSASDTSDGDGDRNNGSRLPRSLAIERKRYDFLKKKRYPYSSAELLELQIARLTPNMPIAIKNKFDSAINPYLAFTESLASAGEQSAYALHYATKESIERALLEDQYRADAHRSEWEDTRKKLFPSASPTPNLPPSPTPSPSGFPDDDDDPFSNEEGEEGEEGAPLIPATGGNAEAAAAQRLSKPFLFGLKLIESSIRPWAKKAILKVSEGPLHHRQIHAKQPLYRDPYKLAYGPPSLHDPGSGKFAGNKGAAYLVPPVDDLRFARNTRLRVPFPADRSLNVLFFNNSRGPMGAAVAAAVASVVKAASPQTEHDLRATAARGHENPSIALARQFLRPDGSFDGAALLNRTRPDAEAIKVHFAVSDLLQRLKRDFRVLVVPGKIAQQAEQAIDALLTTGSAAEPPASAGPADSASTSSKQQKEKEKEKKKKLYREGIWTNGLPALPSYLDDSTLLYGAFSKTAFGIVLSDCRGIAAMPAASLNTGARLLLEGEQSAADFKTEGAGSSEAETSVQPSKKPKAMPSFVPLEPTFKPIAENVHDRLDVFESAGNPKDVTFSTAYAPAPVPVDLMSHYTEDCLSPIPSTAVYFDVDGTEIDRDSSRGDRNIPPSSVLWLDHWLNEAMAADIPLLRIRVYTEAAAERSGQRREREFERENWLAVQREKAAAGGGGGRLLLEAEEKAATPSPVVVALPRAPPNPYWSEGVTGTTLTFPQPGQEGDYSAREQNIIVDKLQQSFGTFYQKVVRTTVQRNKEIPIPSPSGTPTPSQTPVVEPSVDPASSQQSPKAAAAAAEAVPAAEEGEGEREGEGEGEQRALRGSDGTAASSPLPAAASAAPAAATSPLPRSLVDGADDSIFRPARFMSEHRGLVSTAIDVVQMLCGFGTKWGPSKEEQLTDDGRGPGDAWNFEAADEYV